MAWLQIVTVAYRFIAMAICTALIFMVFIQRDRDRAGCFFASMAFCGAMVAFFSLLSTFVGLTNADVPVARKLYSFGSIFAALFPFFIFMFTVEFLGMWTRWRRWTAGILFLFGLLTSLRMLTDTAFETFRLDADGYFTYQIYPIIEFAIAVGTLGNLLAIQAVIQRARSNKTASRKPERGLVMGLSFLYAGFLLLAVPGIRRLALDLAVWAVGFVILAFPVFRQRLFDPLTPLIRELTHLNKQLRTITRVGQQANSFLKLDTLLDVITEEIQRAFNYYAVAILLPEAAGMVVKASAGISSEAFLASGVRQSVDTTSLVGTAAKTRQVVNVGNVLQDRRYIPHILRPDARAEIALPLLIGEGSSEETLIGVLDIQSEQTGAFEPEDIKVLEILANQIAIAIRNAELFEEAQYARQKADEANRHKTAFLSQMSHELRTPLTTVIGRSQWMLRHRDTYGNAVLPDAYVKDLRTIEDSGKQLLSLVNDILDLSKIEAGELLMAATLVNPRMVLQTVQAAYSGALAPDVQIVNRYPDQLPSLWGDPLRISQILGNLVGNACKFTQRGQITLDAQVQGNLLEFSVIDTGPGIPPGVQDVLFRPYTPANHDVVHRHGGTGLGLSICKQLVDLHGGDIWFESVPGQGAAFHFTIPLASADEVASGVVSQQASSRVVVFPKCPERLSAQVLVIDAASEPRAREQVDTVLTQAGYEVVSTESISRAATLAALLDLAAVVILVSPECAIQAHDLVQRLRDEKNLDCARLIEYPIEAMEMSIWQAQLLGQLPPATVHFDPILPGRNTAGRDGKRVTGSILVLDTHPDTRQQLTNTLSEAGYTVLAVRTITEVAVRGSFADLQALIVVRHPDNAREIQQLVEFLQDDATLAAARIIECQASECDWDVFACQQLSDRQV